MLAGISKLPRSNMLNAKHCEAIDNAGDVIVKKRYTNWAVGLTGAHIARYILNDTRQIMPLTTCVRGFRGIDQDPFLSMPCSVGLHDVRRVIDIPLMQYEVDAFLKSADAVWEIQSGLWEDI
jgi:L-lactate dehydrogenase